MAKTYSKDFKVHACKMVIEDKLKPQVIAEKFCINEVMLYRWVNEYQTYGAEAFVGKGHQKPADAELKRLRRENEQLKIENEILKKAAAYFAKHPDSE